MLFSPGEHTIRGKSLLVFQHLLGGIACCCANDFAYSYIFLCSAVRRLSQTRQEAQRGPGKHSRGVPLKKKIFFKWRILVYFTAYILSEGGPPKRRGARSNLPLSTPLSRRKAWFVVYHICGPLKLDRSTHLDAIWQVYTLVLWGPMTHCFRWGF